MSTAAEAFLRQLAHDPPPSLADLWNAVEAKQPDPVALAELLGRCCSDIRVTAALRLDGPMVSVVEAPEVRLADLSRAAQLEIVERLLPALRSSAVRAPPKGLHEQHPGG